MMAFLYHAISLLEQFLKHEEGLYLLRWMDVYNIFLSSQTRKHRLVYPIVSVSYCCVTNHPKSFSAFKWHSFFYSWLGLAIWAGLRWDSLPWLYAMLAGLIHLRLKQGCRGQLGAVPSSSRRVSAGCSHSNGIPRGWQPKRQIVQLWLRIPTSSFLSISIGRNKLWC